MKKPVFLAVLIALGVALTSCSGKPSEPVTLRIGVLPVLDTLPLHVAVREGYFQEAGLNVELVPVSSAPERDQLMQAGQLDGMLTEVVTTLLYNREQPLIKIVRFARTATADYPLFRILASSASGIESTEDLAGVPVGISEGTVIEYTTDRLLQHAGLSPNEIVKLAVPRIPDRFALLASGELQAANLPDPLASLAIQAGARLVIDDSSLPEVGHSVLAFSIAFLDQHPEAVRAFLAALEEAVMAINGDKARWSGLFTELELVPAPLLGSYVIPDYPLASVPSQSQFADSLAWAKERGLIQADLSYSDCVDPSFLP